MGAEANKTNRKYLVLKSEKIVMGAYGIGSIVGANEGNYTFCRMFFVISGILNGETGLFVSKAHMQVKSTVVVVVSKTFGESRIGGIDLIQEVRKAWHGIIGNVVSHTQRSIAAL